MRGGNTGFSFFMPASALDGEAAVLRPDVEYRLFGPTYCVSPQAGQDQAVVLDFAASGVAVLRMADANGAEFLNTSLAVGLKRDSVSVTVDPKERPLPWTLEVTGGVKVRARQTGLLYLAPDKKRLNVVLAAVAAQK
jgi:hypothetical protein